ncbi:MAG TPA: hypothetical protein VK571_03285, partial [Gemmatimonadaceae bacterium]|nr:hypothetical protein [Gemmatimonadaceae bacterium]
MTGKLLSPRDQAMISHSVRVLFGALALLAGTACNDSSGPGDGGNPLPPGIGLQLDPFITSGLSSPV